MSWIWAITAHAQMDISQLKIEQDVKVRSIDKRWKDKDGVIVELLIQLDAELMDEE